MDAVFEFLETSNLGLAESPVWDTRRKILWFVDITGHALHWFDPVRRTTASFPMPASIGSAALAQDGRLVVALRSGVHLFDPGDATLTFLVHPEPERTMNLLNDGRVGPDGCFWVGSIHEAVPRQPTGALYRVSPEGVSHRVIDGVAASNGLAWSPDGRVLYHADSRATRSEGVITRYPFDPATGQIGTGTEIARLSEAEGLPDGAAVDVDGIYWSAGVTAGCLNRFAPDGTLIERMALPVAAPTMPCFGGQDGRTVFVTSLTTDRGGTAESGRLIAFRADVTAPPQPLFDTWRAAV